MHGGYSDKHGDKHSDTNEIQCACFKQSFKMKRFVVF